MLIPHLSLSPFDVTADSLIGDDTEDDGCDVQQLNSKDQSNMTCWKINLVVRGQKKVKKCLEKI